MFKLDNYAIKEILCGTVQDSNNNLLSVLTDISKFNVDVTADAKEMKDKNGTTMKSTYTAKSGILNFTSATHSVALLSLFHEVDNATDDSPLIMPAIATVRAGGKVNVADAETGSISLVSTYDNGGLAKRFTKSEISLLITNGYLEIPKDAVGDSFTVVYDRNVYDGVRLRNMSNDTSKKLQILFSCVLLDPCDSKQRAAYVYFPNVSINPNRTIDFNSDSSESEVDGVLGIDYCSACKQLYMVYFPNEESIAMVGDCKNLLNPSLNISVREVVLANSETVDFTIDTNSTGKITVESNEIGIASVSKLDDNTYRITADASNFGNAVVTVSVSATDTFKSSSKKIRVSVKGLMYATEKDIDMIIEQTYVLSGDNQAAEESTIDSIVDGNFDSDPNVDNGSDDITIDISGV